jgi:hypothetical protein
MKFWYFIKWSYNRTRKEVASWEQWQWMWLVTMSFMWAYVFSPKDSNGADVWLTMLCATVVIYWFGYALVFKSIKNAWSNFNKEQQDLVNNLKVDHDVTR